MSVRSRPEGDQEITVALDELARQPARRMIAAALRAEADEYVEGFGGERDEDGQSRAARGRDRPRPDRHPPHSRNDKRSDEETGERQRFSSPDPVRLRQAVAEGGPGDEGRRLEGRRARSR